MMKKLLCLTLVAVIALILIATPAMAETSEIRVILNGEVLEFDVPPMIVDNRTLVPLRAISEAINANVDWCGYTQTVTITSVE